MSTGTWADSWLASWGSSWGRGAEAVVAEEVLSGGYFEREPKRKRRTGYEMAMEGLARMEYVKPQMRKKSIVEPTNKPIESIDSDEDDIKAIMLLIH